MPSNKSTLAGPGGGSSTASGESKAAAIAAGVSFVDFTFPDLPPGIDLVYSFPLHLLVPFSDIKYTSKG